MVGGAEGVVEGVVVYLIEAACGMRGLRHSSEADPNTSQVKVTWSPGHVNRPCLLEISSTLSAMRKMIKWQYTARMLNCYIHVLLCRKCLAAPLFHIW